MHPKIQNSGITGAVGVVVVYILAQVNVQLPPEVWVAIVSIISAAAGWLTPSPKA